jgi:hypothetical protein
LRDIFEKGYSIAEIFKINSAGIVTARDELTIFPLYLYPEKDSKTASRTPNLNSEIVQKIADGLGLKFTNEKEIRFRHIRSDRHSRLHLRRSAQPDLPRKI